MPEGAPSKCDDCLRRDIEFGCFNEGSVHFVGNHVPSKGADDDRDAWARSDGQ